MASLYSVECVEKTIWRGPALGTLGIRWSIGIQQEGQSTGEASSRFCVVLSVPVFVCPLVSVLFLMVAH